MTSSDGPMSQFKTPSRVRFFEAAALLVIVLTGIWFAGLVAFAAARHRGLI